ncbi:Lrp/AsnC family transcriptional regulator [Thermogymnomonas acidicola]|uniref:Lrp/AsnC family transcriptional regulator n=1 Tax=Thermogymnomonas acidicola TaxID=399579 RepID=UPI0009463C1F|nr:Lrp/AsnC family transcriptional regulator [Thermogymnomonas acidicola]
MDKKDILIIRYLSEHGRDKISNISSSLGIPRATVFERIQKLVASGYIKKFTIEVDFEKLGLPILSYILLHHGLGSVEDTLRRLSSLDCVVSAALTTGCWDIIMLTAHRSMKDLSDFVVNELQRLTGSGNFQILPPVMRLEKQ